MRVIDFTVIKIDFGKIKIETDLLVEDKVQMWLRLVLRLILME